MDGEDAMGAFLSPNDPIISEYVPKFVAEERIDYEVNPTDKKWRAAHDMFVQLLNSKEKTIQQILKENFTYYEAQRLFPSNLPYMKNFQEEEAKQYHKLFQGPFKDVEPNLSTKLTMLYFGLSIEAMDCPLEELAASLEKREPEGPHFEVAPPLHFLTAHKHRNWGDDSLRVREDPIQPISIPDPEPVATLRGGELSPERNPPVDTVDYMPEGEEAMEPTDDWVYLYGLQGCIPFVPNKWRTFSAAIRQLLFLRFHDARPRHFIFTQFDKKTHQVLNHGKEPLPLTKDSSLVAFIQKHCAADSHTRDCCAFFIKDVADERRDVAWEPQPMLFKTDLAKIGFPVFSVPEEPRQLIVRYAYLAFPKTRERTFTIDKYNANQFNEHFQAAVEVLVGRPEGSFHRSFYKLYDQTRPRVISTYVLEFYGPHETSVYGGMALKMSLWDELHPLNNPLGRWMLKATAIGDNEIALVLPNFYNYIFPIVKKEVDYGNELAVIPIYLVEGPFPEALSLIQWLTKNIRINTKRREVNNVRLIPGNAALGEVIDRNEQGLVIRGDASKETLLAEIPRFLQKLVDDKAEPFVLVHPIWEPGEARFLPGWIEEPKEDQYVEMPPLGSFFNDFINSIHELCQVAEYTGGYNPKMDSIILITLGPQTKRYERVESPSFVITPTTSDDDWHRIRARIITDRIEVTIKSKLDVDWKSSIPKSNIWGPRISPGKGYWEPVEQVELESRFYHAELEEPRRLADVIPQPGGPGHGYRLGNRGDASQIAEPQESRDSEHIFVPERPTSPHPVDSDERFASWSAQPSIFDHAEAYEEFGDIGLWSSGDAPPLVPEIPINAPPVEAILRTTSSVPMVSKAVLTVTEQQRLQSDFWELRNMILNRTAKCPYKNCNFSYRLDREVDMQHHLVREHRVNECLWCREPLWEFWDMKQKRDHLRNEHRGQLARILEPDAAATTAVPPTQDPMAQRMRQEGILGSFSGFPVQRPARTAPQANPPVGGQRGTTRQAGRPKDPPRQLSFPLDKWYDQPGPVAYDDPCEFCHVLGCPQPDLEKLSAQGVFEHFLKHHKTAEPVCPFCQLPFGVEEKDENGVVVARKPRLREEIIKHFECHVNGLWDILSPSRKTQPLETATALQEASTRENQAVEIVRKCPFFEDCGAIIQFMTNAQIIKHIRTCHPEDTHPPRPSRASGVQGSLDRAQDDPEEQTEIESARSTPKKVIRVVKSKANTPLKQRPKRAHAASALAESEVPDSATSGLETRPSSETSPEKRPAKRARASRKVADRQESQDITTGSEATTGSSPASRGRTPAKKVGSRLRTVQASIEADASDYGPSDDDQQGEGSTRRRRAESPDWNELLGPEDPNFEPDENMYCSKCLRKAPRHREPVPGKPGMGRTEEMKHHHAKDRCCKIRNGPGEPDALPNRSGWITMPNSRQLGPLKKKFLKRYPTYANTIYPTKGDNNLTLWRSDPNNPDNKDWWDIPWPPFEGKPPFPGEWKSPGYQGAEGAGRKGRRDVKGPKMPYDPLYKYRSDEDSDDGLQPDVDDIKEFQESSPNPGESSNSKSKGKERLEPSPNPDSISETAKGRRKRPEATPTPSTPGQQEQTLTGSEDAEAGPATKKAKPNPTPKSTQKTPAKRLKVKPSATSSATPSRTSSRQRAARESSAASSRKS
ncbi:hypothetical protein G7Z17_g3293 [Cylindrodendrum hubeiense]|uniref:C2H2-type domain-containing protein n=1 Tax=Cylindrodendrum hubeiense TaxID=595255 RepID=A0A9P5HJ75_9HYPO|nr:hypothetical protein G7Z17_g3293 [Cylindrodendrum hubeiense]